jgi:hypothetical protein
MVSAVLFSARHSFHQQARNLIFQLHGLVDQQIVIPQRVPAFANFGRGHVALRQKITAQAVGDLVGIDAIVFLLGGGNGPQQTRPRPRKAEPCSFASSNIPL